LNDLLKAIVKRPLAMGVSLLGRSKTGRYLFSLILEQALSKTQTLRRGEKEFCYAVANPLLQLRAKTLFTKEPETLEWIDRMPQGAVLWDVGANVGTYSIYGAVSRRLRVFAFEPSVFNLEFLARNINLNKAVDQITIVPMALSDRRQVNEMRLTSSAWGGALSTFGETYDGNGEAINQIFGYEIPGLTMDDARDIFAIPQPDHIKIDVDGIEALVLAGGPDVLAKTKSVLIEINDEFEMQAKDCERILKSQGFVLKEKRQSDFEKRQESDHFVTFNQIWERD